MLTGHEKVDAIANIKITGDIIPSSWYQHIKYKTAKGGKKVDLLAIAILADIVYWYRPFEKRHEMTGESLGWHKKFKGEKLQRSLDAFSQKFSHSIRCIRESIKVLEVLELIQVSYNSVRTQYGVLPNVMFIDVNPGAIAKITYLPEPHKDDEILEKSMLSKWGVAETPEKSLPTKCVTKQTSLKTAETLEKSLPTKCVTKQTSLKTAETLEKSLPTKCVGVPYVFRNALPTKCVGVGYEMGSSSIYIDFLETSKKNKQREEADSLSGNFLNEEEDALSEADASESCPEESQGEEVANISSLTKEQLNCNKHKESDPEDKGSAPVLQQAQKDVNDNKMPEWAMGQNEDGTFQASRDFVAWLANDYWVAKGDKYARNKSYARAYLEKAGKTFRANELWEEYQSRIGEIEFVAQLREQMKPADSGEDDRITDEERIAKFSAIQEQILALKNKADS